MNTAAIYQRVAEQVWNPTDPLACEASVLLTHAAKMTQLTSPSLTVRITKLIGRVFS